MVTRYLPFALAIALLSGCSGGEGSTSTAVPPVVAQPGQNASVTFTMHFSAPGTSAVRRHYVSPSTTGVNVQVYLASDTSHAHVIASQATDVSAGSAACGGSTSPSRTCSVAVPAPAGADAFVFSTYDAPPVSGTIPSSAALLGQGTVASQTIVANTVNTVNVYISGDVAGYGAASTYASLAADGSPHTFAFVIAPKDFDNNTIAAGSNDPYLNPITVTLAEAGGTGHASLVLNGTNAGSSATLHSSSDSVSLLYDGGGSAGYGASVTLAASGVPSQTLAISPLYMTSTSPYFSNGTLLFSAPNQSAVIALSERNAPASISYSAQLQNCSGIATAGSASGSGAAATITVTSGSTAGTGCSVSFADNMTTALSAPVALTVTGGSFTINGHTFTSYALNNANGITTGPDGNLWVSAGSSVVRLTTSGSMSTYTAPVMRAGGSGGGSTSLGEITTGPDGRLWTADHSNAKVYAYTTSGSKTTYPISNPGAGVTSGPDGNLWIATYGSSGQCNIDVMTITGTYFAYSCANNAQPWQIATASDGRMWFAESAKSGLGIMTTGGSYSELALNGYETGITAGPDGNLWVPEQVLSPPPSMQAGGYIAKVTTLGVETDYFISTTSLPAHMTVAADESLWFTDQGTQSVGRITTSGTITEFALPSGGTPRFITLGPDGNIWFTTSSAVYSVTP